MADGCGSYTAQFLPCFDRERLQCVEIETLGNGDVFESVHLLGVVFLSLDIAAVLNLYLGLLDNLVAEFLFVDIVLKFWGDLLE